MPYPIQSTWSDLDLGDDTGKFQVLSPAFTFYGTEYSQVYICSNGFLDFDIASNSPNYCSFGENLDGLFDHPRIAALWDDLYPGNDGAAVYFETIGSGSAAVHVVTFDQVPEYRNQGSNTFQVALHSDGTIDITYLDCNDSDGLVGILYGYLEAASPVETDFSSPPATLDSVWWHKNDAMQSFSSHLVTSTANNVKYVYPADVDGDTDVDLLAAFSGGHYVSWFENDGPAVVCGTHDLKRRRWCQHGDLVRR